MVISVVNYQASDFWRVISNFQAGVLPLAAIFLCPGFWFIQMLIIGLWICVYTQFHKVIHIFNELSEIFIYCSVVMERDRCLINLCISSKRGSQYMCIEKLIFIFVSWSFIFIVFAGIRRCHLHWTWHTRYSSYGRQDWKQIVSQECKGQHDSWLWWSSQGEKSFNYRLPTVGTVSKSKYTYWKSDAESNYNFLFFFRKM